jgi:hypothetical protein
MERSQEAHTSATLLTFVENTVRKKDEDEKIKVLFACEIRDSKDSEIVPG